MRLRAIATASILVMLADPAWADTALVLIDARPRRQRAEPPAARIADALGGPGVDGVRHIAAETPEGFARAGTLAERASDALTRFRDREALELVAEAEQALSDADLGGPEARDLLVRLNWIAAQSYMALGRPQRVDAACRLAHRIAPDRRLPRDELAPAFVERCEKAARRNARSLPLSVAVEPRDARASLDLVPVDAGRLTVPEGDHYLLVEADGHLPVLRRVTVADRGAATVVKLAAVPPERRHARAAGAAVAGRRSWAAIAREVTRPGAREVVVVLLGPDRMSVLDHTGRRVVREGSAEQARLAISGHLQGAPADPDGTRLTARSPEAPAPPGRPWYRRGWLWVGVGVAAAGIAAGSYLWLSRDQEYVLDDWSLSR